MAGRRVPSPPTSLSPEEAFALLGNDTRIDILLALWDTFESGRYDNAVSYTDLFDRVDIRDSGNFSYHLEKLTGPFVRRTDDGYELKQTGINIVRAVIAGTVTDDPSIGPTPVDTGCPRCGAPVEIRYGDEFMAVRCPSCDGARRWNGEPGILFGALVPPAGIVGRPAEDAFQAAVAYSLNQVAAFNDGVCPHCASPPVSTLEVCTEHVASEDSLCPNCDRLNMAVVWMVCSTCKRSVPPPVRLVVLADPTVAGFYHERGISHRFATWETVTRCFAVEEDLLSEEPLRMRYTVPAGDESLRLTLDGALNVLDMSV